MSSNSHAPNADVLRRLYPELPAGGFSHDDGTVEFFTRVNALIEPSMTVLDFGAGRGEWHRDPVVYRQNLRTLRGKVAKVIGADVDPVVIENPTVDEAVVCSSDAEIPLQTGSVDLIVADHTFEHIDRPKLTAAELTRILRPGGWICARTPNRWGYVAAAARIVPNSKHVMALRRLQPQREAADVFPTRYRLNTRNDVRRVFPAEMFDNFTYYWRGEPGYFGRSAGLARAIRLSLEFLPARLQPKLFIFLRKRDTGEI